MGRDPAAVGVVDGRPRVPRPRSRLAVRPARARRLEAVSRRGRRSPPTRGVSVTRVGHRSRPARAARCGHPRRRARAHACRRLARERGDPRARRLGRSSTRSRARRLGVRVRQRPLSRHRRRRHRRHRAERDGDGPPGRPASVPLDGGNAVLERRVGGVRQGQRRRLALLAALLRLRRRHRSAVARRHGPRC